ncbi:MAG: AraC family transcriptional regulator [Kiloniellales bacterium]|nr:AraC family transcriptional regulator [Kiloniellales bacterium]
MPLEPKILAAAGSGILAALERAGVPPAPLLNQAGLPPEAFRDPSNRIPLRRFVRLLELAARETGDPCFGLHHGAAYHLSEAGVLGYAMLSAPTVGAAAVNLTRFIRMQVDRLEVALEQDEAQARLGFRLTDAKITARRQYNERLLALAFNAFRDTTGTRWFPEAVCFEHEAPDDDSEHRRFFGAPLRFGQASNQLVFERGFLDRPLKTADPRLFQALVPQIETQLQAVPQGDGLAAEIQELLAASLKDGRPSLARVANELGLGTRTLQRRLKERDIAFWDLVEGTRRQLAESYLDEGRLTISEVAYLLGYSELSAFSRAYRRWTGAAPVDSRQKPQPSAPGSG